MNWTDRVVLLAAAAAIAWAVSGLADRAAFTREAAEIRKSIPARATDAGAQAGGSSAFQTWEEMKEARVLEEWNWERQGRAFARGFVKGLLYEDPGLAELWDGLEFARTFRKERLQLKALGGRVPDTASGPGARPRPTSADPQTDAGD